MEQDVINVSFVLQSVIVILISVLGWLGSRLFLKIEEMTNEVKIVRIEHASDVSNVKSKIEHIYKDILRIEKELEKLS